MKPRLRSTVCLAACLALAQCTPYAGHKSSMSTEAFLAYRPAAKITKGGPQTESAMLAGAAVSAATFIIGYLFEQADKAITKAREGEYSASDYVPALATSPGNGYFVILRTVKPSAKLAEVTTVADFIDEAPERETPGRRLHAAMVHSGCVAAGNIRPVVRDLAAKNKIPLDEHIALLVVCPVVLMNPQESPAIYAVLLDGMYFPVLKGRRFAGESSDLFSRVAKSQESMTLEVYGPHGSGYTSGIVKVPLVWTPPGKGGERGGWVSSDRLKEVLNARHNKDGIETLDQLTERDVDKRLARRQAFLPPDASYARYVRADAKVSETTEATGWILKLTAKLKDEVTGLIKP